MIKPDEDQKNGTNISRINHDSTQFNCEMKYIDVFFNRNQCCIQIPYLVTCHDIEPHHELLLNYGISEFEG